VRSCPPARAKATTAAEYETRPATVDHETAEQEGVLVTPRLLAAPSGPVAGHRRTRRRARRGHILNQSVARSRFHSHGYLSTLIGTSQHANATQLNPRDRRFLGQTRPAQAVKVALQVVFAPEGLCSSVKLDRGLWLELAKLRHRSAGLVHAIQVRVCCSEPSVPRGVGASHLEECIKSLFVASCDEVHAPKHIALIERRMIRVQAYGLLNQGQSLLRSPCHA
jgi:hypothetical protein